MNEINNLPAPTRSRPQLVVNGQASLGDKVRALRLNPAGPGFKPRSAYLPWGFTVIALALAVVFGWRAYLLSPLDAASAADSGTSRADIKAPAGPSTDSRPTASPGDVVLDSRGYIIAAHQIQLSPQVGGEIIWLDPGFKEGAVYKKGDRFAEIDPVIYAEQLKSSEAALSVAEVNLRQVETGSTLNEIKAARAQLKNLSARLDLSMIDENTKRMAGPAVSRDELAKAAVQTVADRAARDQQKEMLDKLEVLLEEQRLMNRAQVRKAQADVALAQKQVKNCTIRAPTDGIVLSKKAELGGYVNPLAFGAAGYLCEMADLTDLEVELDIQERDNSLVRIGQRCRIMPETGQRDDEFLRTHPDGYVGVVSRRMPVANRSKGAVTWRVKVKFPEGEKSATYLLPDMGVMVWFLK